MTDHGRQSAQIVERKIRAPYEATFGLDGDEPGAQRTSGSEIIFAISDDGDGAWADAGLAEDEAKIGDLVGRRSHHARE